MIRCNALVGAVLAITLAGCDQRDISDKPEPDRPTMRVPGGEGGALPRGASRDAQGRWTIVSVPPLNPATLSNRAQMQAVMPGAHLAIFAEAPPDPAKVRQARSVVSDLVLRTASARIIVDRGCLRLDTPSRPLVRFVAPPLLQRDREGYLVIGGHDADGAPSYARVGEPVTWVLGGLYSANGEAQTGLQLVTDPAALAPIHATCGAGPVVRLPTAMQSKALQAFSVKESAIKAFQDTYGVSEAEARRHFAKCGNRAQTPCGVMPPPPVPDGKLCPAGTNWSSGLCRTKDGYVRPVPQIP